VSRYKPGRLRPDIWLVVVASFLVVPFLTSCGAVTTGHVSGFVLLRSGIDPIAQPPERETKVTATPTEGDGHQTWSAKAGSDGSFALDIPPGTYELTAVTATQSGEWDQATPEEATVTAGGLTQVTLYVNYP